MPIVPFDRTLIEIPAVVAKTSDALAAALAARTRVRAELAVKADEQRAAQRADQAAAREAVAAGKTPPASAAATIAEEHDRAARAVPASEQLVKQAEDAYLAAVRDRFDELRATLDDRQRAIREEARSTLDALAGAIREQIALSDLDRELHMPNLQGRLRSFEPVRVTRRKDPAAAIIEPVRAALGDHEGNRFTTRTLRRAA